MTRRALWITVAIPVSMIVLFLFHFRYEFMDDAIEPAIRKGTVYCSQTKLQPVRKGEPLRVSFWRANETFRVGRDRGGQEWIFGMEGEHVEFTGDEGRRVPVYYWFRVTSDRVAKVLFDGEGTDRTIEETHPHDPFRDNGEDIIGKIRSEPRWHPLHWLDPSFKREALYLDLDGRTYHSDQSGGWGWPRYSPDKSFMYITGGFGSAPGYDGGEGRTTVEVFRTRDQQRIVYIDILRRHATGGFALPVMRWLSDTDVLLLSGLVANECLFCRLEK
ncbi:hypothetical protein [uncultured Paludibaculum sp.]|uniref:hypothetical protein n=1 Tax=uncultured Paludibaculum sp. TaxID=1765020 RepID=UPI002AAAD176|nr:hypothetical protein [uncultured Paludibaculum sp.]